MSGHFEAQDGFANVNGKRIHYLCAGSGEPLLLLHSNGGSAYEYEEMFSLLAKRFRAIAWDMPGHGDSDPLDRHLGVDDYADAAIALLDTLEIRRAFVAGASIGGAICVSLAARYADRLRHCIIVECPYRTAAEWKGMWLQTETNYSQATQSREKVAARVNGLTDHHLTRWNIDRNKAGTKTMLSVMWALREFDIEASLKRVGANASLLFGEKGPTIAKLDRFRSILANARTIVLENVGHFPMLDDPSAFTNAILDLTGQIHTTEGSPA